MEGGKGKGEVEGRDMGNGEGEEEKWESPPPVIFGLKVALTDNLATSPNLISTVSQLSSSPVIVALCKLS